MIADRYDAIAKDLCAEWKRGQESWGGVWFTEDSLAAALRRVAAEARAEAVEWAATEMEKARDAAEKHRCPHYESCIYCARRDAFDEAADTIRALAKEQSKP